MNASSKTRPSAEHAYSLTPRDALERAGGIAGARWIADWLAKRLRQPVRVRQVRDRLKHYGDSILRLGAGYYAVTGTHYLPVDVWATRWLARRAGPAAVDDLVEAILDAYPRGDDMAVRCWVYQEVGALRVRDGEVWLVSQLYRLGDQ